MNGRPPDGDTSLGGARRSFPSTCWSRFAAEPEGDAGRGAVESLAKAYWKPVYAFIRFKWAKSNDDAKDLTQDFFIWMLESGFIGQADPARGRFRAFIRSALQNYLSKKDRDAHALKRGGGRKIVDIDDPAAVEVVDPGSKSPEAVLDEVWRNELFARAVEKLEQELRGEGRETGFRVFRDFHLPGAEAPSYRELAAKHGISEKEVDNHLAHAKRRCRVILEALVAETVGSYEDLQDEVRILFDPGTP